MVQSGRKGTCDIFKGLIIEYICKKNVKQEIMATSKRCLIKTNHWVDLLPLIIFGPAKPIIDLILNNFDFFDFAIAVVVITVYITISYWLWRSDKELKENFDELVDAAETQLRFLDKNTQKDEYEKLEQFIENIKSERRNTDDINKIILDNPKFDKNINVYAINEARAKQYLTPAFMDRLYKLNTIFKADGIRCAFYENKLMIAIETSRDLFEFGDLFKPISDTSSILQLYRELNSIYNIIDVLNLNKED